MLVGASIACYHQYPALLAGRGRRLLPPSFTPPRPPDARCLPPRDRGAGAARLRHGHQTPRAAGAGQRHPRTFYADGRGVAANPLKAAEWYEKAATRGIAEAANSLGRLYENGIGVSADREKAIEWYYRAAVAFKKTGRREDAAAVIHHLDGLARQYPAVLGLVTRLRQTLALVKE
ncbi:MAG: tetratricopeptide repeat protein [Sulfuricaulis sp.]|nr:tetratricopeptide repeat protein [Sulfuricaulis sp.]